jgi:hypothetical protein
MKLGRVYGLPHHYLVGCITERVESRSALLFRSADTQADLS